MFNFCLYRFIAQKVCAFPIKTQYVLPKNTVCFIQKDSMFYMKTQYVFIGKAICFYSC
jgi:hypothetical protein